LEKKGEIGDSSSLGSIEKGKGEGGGRRNPASNVISLPPPTGGEGRGKKEETTSDHLKAPLGEKKRKRVPPFSSPDYSENMGKGKKRKRRRTRKNSPALV